MRLTIPRKPKNYSLNIFVNEKGWNENKARVKKSDSSYMHKKNKLIAKNWMIHGYDTASEDIIWSILINDSPQLAKEVGTILDE